MTNFSESKSSLSGTTSIPVRYTLYGDIEQALDRNGATVHELVERAFLEIADIGNSFSLIYHHFEWVFDDETLQFSCASLRYKPGGEIHFTVSLVDAPMTYNIDEMPEAARELLAGIEADGKTKQ